MATPTHLKASLALTLAILGNLAHAGEPSPERVSSNLTAYLGQGVDANLLEIPGDLFGGSLTRDDTWFAGIGYQHGLAPPGWLDAAFRWARMDGVGTAVELVALQHWGLQDNAEAGVAYAIRSPKATLGPVTVGAGFSIGFSYAFGTPSYEDGPKDDPEKRYRFQNYNAYELEWGLKRFPSVSFVTRVHHRSGAYGLIAPRRVGSNFITAGLRFQW